MIEHTCLTCSKERPECGHVRQVSEGYCNDWGASISSKELKP
jgi:hypothetical protein